EGAKKRTKKADAVKPRTGSLLKSMSLDTITLAGTCGDRDPGRRPRAGVGAPGSAVTVLPGAARERPGGGWP
ncbi:hypothetical protein, partial [Streptosporangium sp. NPDC048865]|uniref:hypothetical protein n=1 Tax=Streptosporangium sp. NPDC048865 TaxID=3155766 RepID=UPI003448DD57